jgi:hypothetical protein
MKKAKREENGGIAYSVGGCNYGNTKILLVIIAVESRGRLC